AGPGLRRRDRTRDGSLLPSPCTGRGARGRVPLRRAERGGGHPQAERDERDWPTPLEAVLLLRTRASGGRPQGLARQGGERRSSSTGLLPPRQDEQRGANRSLRTGDGARSGYRLRTHADDEPAVHVVAEDLRRSLVRVRVDRQAVEGHLPPSVGPANGSERSRDAADLLGHR